MTPDAVRAPDGGPARPATWPGTWPLARWVRVLDRMEFRQEGVGLRFRGPPLWLEVTMSGPDSDQWPVTGQPDQAWNWQSSTTCVEADELAAAGASDSEVLAAASRYTVENLILNAVHEIGEWLRLDGRRLYPAHLPAGGHDGAVVDADGNGPVHLEVDFGALSDRAGSPSPAPATDGAAVAESGMAAAVAASRFTYLPATAISYDPGGPVVTRYGGAPSAWHASWSGETARERRGDPPGDAVESVARDVHRTVVAHEADRVCRAFRVDGQRVWTVAPEPGAGGGDDIDGATLAPLSLRITYAPGAGGASGAPAGHWVPVGDTPRR